MCMNTETANLDELIKFIDSKKFETEEDVELLKKLNELVVSALAYAEAVTSESK